MFLFSTGKDEYGKRQYARLALSEKEMRGVWQCVLHGMGRSDIVKVLDALKPAA